MAMSANSKKVFEYLQNHKGEDFTAADVAAALELEKRQVDGIFTSAIQRKGYGIRVPAEIENPDGTHTGIKLLQLTEEGYALDLNAIDAE